MTRDEVAEIVHGMPQGMNADDYLVELVNRALAKREWVGLTEDEAKQLYEDSATEWRFAQAIEVKLKEKNA